MSPDVAYAILTVIVLLAAFFLYRTYQEAQKNPGRWALRELATEWFSRILGA